MTKQAAARPCAIGAMIARRQRGSSVLEIVLAVGIVSVVSGSAVGLLHEWRARARGEGAARLVSNQVRLARALSVRDGAQVGIVFQRDRRGDTVFRLHRDGNGNGVRRAETVDGTDPPLGDTIDVSHAFPGTRIAIARRVPGIDGGSVLDPGSDAVRLAGGTEILSVGPTGTTTAGTVYVAGTREEVFAVRTVAMGGRLRLLEFSPATGAWQERW